MFCTTRSSLPSCAAMPNKGIRFSETYLRMADLVDHVVPCLLYLLIGYLLLAVWSVFVHDSLAWQLAAILLVCRRLSLVPAVYGEPAFPDAGALCCHRHGGDGGLACR